MPVNLHGQAGEMELHLSLDVRRSSRGVGRAGGSLLQYGTSCGGLREQNAALAQFTDTIGPSEGLGQILPPIGWMPTGQNCLRTTWRSLRSRDITGWYIAHVFRYRRYN